MSIYVLYASDNDFATTLLVASNAIERCRFAQTRALRGPGLPATGLNNKADQLGHIHRAMHHRAHQAEY
jgi:hypothetical protein